MEGEIKRLSLRIVKSGKNPWIKGSSVEIAAALYSSVVH
jgi:hypothetical protein